MAMRTQCLAGNGQAFIVLAEATAVHFAASSEAGVSDSLDTDMTSSA